MVKIQCLSLWQPYASLVAHGLKKVETRSWPWPFLDPLYPLPAALAIHATKKWNGDLYNLCLSEPFRSALAKCGIRTQLPTRGKLPAPDGMPFGAVVAVVRVVECVPTQKILDGISDCKAGDLADPPISQREYAFGDYSFGRFAWVTDAVLRLEQPVPVTGRQGLFSWEATPEVEAWIYEHLKRAEV